MCGCVCGGVGEGIVGIYLRGKSNCSFSRKSMREEDEPVPDWRSCWSWIDQGRSIREEGEAIGCHQCQISLRSGIQCVVEKSWHPIKVLLLNEIKWWGGGKTDY